jgi:hypothetical protein
MQQQSPPPPGDGEDPYGSVKEAIDKELSHITRLQARLFSGNADVATQLASALRDTEEQLAALEAAVARMVGDPATFGLTPAAAFGRQVCDARGCGCCGCVRACAVGVVGPEQHGWRAL